MSRRSPTVGRKVPRSSYVQDRRAILKLVPKLRKIKPPKGGWGHAETEGHVAEVFHHRAYLAAILARHGLENT
jgi:hypothetical protein